MESAVASQLIELNRQFYTRFGDSFSATRHRIQPGVRRVIESLRGDEDILDLGCGNGWFARELAKHGHRGSYLGVDFSLPLLRDAESQPSFVSSQDEGFSAAFRQGDLTALESATFNLQPSTFDLVTAFAVLHHIPSVDIRLDILKTVRQLLKPNGLFIHSNWQFLNSEKLKSRIQDWSKAGLSPDDVDPNDYLLDWRSGGKGLRYVHHFDKDELQELSEAVGFQIKDVFYSDGETWDLGLYQVWSINPLVE
ncbi:MAG TPA: class I SAM-dependent methyltransferase [Anaerolineales bacterium]|nr:class I SAM-dependent methyltransferase [Anaerolineales bacterium]